MLLPIVGNPAAAALALMIQKGGTIRLRRAELDPMNQFALSVEPNEKNPEVLHFKVVTQYEARQIMVAKAIALNAIVEAVTQQDTPAEEPDEEAAGS